MATSVTGQFFSWRVRALEQARSEDVGSLREGYREALSGKGRAGLWRLARRFGGKLGSNGL